MLDVDIFVCIICPASIKTEILIITLPLISSIYFMCHFTLKRKLLVKSMYESIVSYNLFQIDSSLLSYTGCLIKRNAK